LRTKRLGFTSLTFLLIKACGGIRSSSYGQRQEVIPGGVFSRNRFGRLLRLNYERPNRMKMVLVAIALAGLLLLFSRNGNAQVYDLY